MNTTTKYEPSKTLVDALWLTANAITPDVINEDITDDNMALIDMCFDHIEAYGGKEADAELSADIKQHGYNVVLVALSRINKLNFI